MPHLEPVQTLAWEILRPLLPTRVQRCSGCYGARRQPTPAQFYEMDAAFYQGLNNNYNNNSQEVEMQSKLVGLVSQRDGRTNRFSSGNRSQSRQGAGRAPSRSKPLYDVPGYCWYHQRFGAKAVKCRLPCTIWKDPPKNLNGKLDRNKVTFLKENEPATS